MRQENTSNAYAYEEAKYNEDIKQNGQQATVNARGVGHKEYENVETEQAEKRHPQPTKFIIPMMGWRK